MAGIAQHVLRYDMIYGTCVLLFFGFVPNWRLFPGNSSHPDERAFSITVTEIATLTQEPSTITTKIPDTVYSTVTKQVTSVSRYVNYLTKYTHYPIDPATPCVTYTHTYSSYPVATPIWNETTAAVVSPDDTTTGFLLGWGTWIFYSMWVIANIFLVYYIFVRPIPDKLDELEYSLVLQKGLLESEQKRHLETREWTDKLATLLLEFKKKNDTLDLRVKVADILFQKLGIYEEGSPEPDNETLAEMVEAKICEISALRLERKRLAQANAIHVAAKSYLEKEIRERLNRDWSAQLNQKQAEVNHWRHYFTQNADEAMKKTQNLLEENKEIQDLREELRRFRGENHVFNEELYEKRQEIERLKLLVKYGPNDSPGCALAFGDPVDRSKLPQDRAGPKQNRTGLKYER
ncbi:predicted protein [Pyrenophora tritici-repentis Pt-1C-BFP]|uniref:Uncharacterized protein n=1 Tax=Pyrenophora tritici-repentis (strain Pt-1C-BFP) TaxID=426418 RepID=B2W295_PYRTR|nr:uncharacterized protein PTRG_03543 [Pyrenophora tritici-repentis Pt-1C-BFP]EDU46381.1 predicted protein [Pyrenophora tritici-repentis Pt-1C-BFP]